jgi:hypothetical protein
MSLCSSNPTSSMTPYRALQEIIRVFKLINKPNPSACECMIEHISDEIAQLASKTHEFNELEDGDYEAYLRNTFRSFSPRIPVIISTILCVKRFHRFVHGVPSSPRRSPRPEQASCLRAYSEPFGSGRSRHGKGAP